MKEKLEQLLETIGYAEDVSESDVLFKKAVGQALRLEVVTLVEVAKGLRVSLPAVNMWCMGHDLPHPAIRLPMLRWLKKKTEEKLYQTVLSAKTNPR